MRVRSIVAATAVLLSSLALAAPPAHAVTEYNSILFDQTSYVYSHGLPSFTTGASEDAATDVVTMKLYYTEGMALGWEQALVPPTGQQLLASTTYPVASTATASAVGVARAGCTGPGMLQVHDLVRDGSGALTAFGADLALGCEWAPGGKAFYSFRWHSTTAPSPATTLGGDAATFGSYDVGQLSTPIAHHVHNGGTVPAQLGDITVSGTHAADFTIAADECSDATLAPGASCTVSVRFGPTGFYARTAVLSVTDGSLRGTREWPLSGYAYGPPTAVTGATATTRSDGVQLSWQPGSNGGRNIQYYEVLRGETAETLEPLGQASALTFADRLGSDTAPVADHDYVYGIRAHNDRGDGPLTVVSGHTPATAVPVTTDAVVTVAGALLAPQFSAQSYVYNAAEGPTVTVAPWFWPGSLVANGTATGVPSTMIRRQPEGNAPELAIGTYTEPFEVLRSGVGTYCENGDWTLEVKEVAYDSDGKFARLAADYLTRCTPNGPPVAGAIRWHSDLPFSAATVTTPAVDFPVKAGATTPLLVTYRNRGTTSITLSSVSLSPSPSTGSTSGWAVTNNPCTGQVLAPGAQCTATVSVAPTATGRKEVLIHFGDDTVIGAQVRKLTVYGITPPPAPYLTGSISASGVKLTWNQTFGTKAQPTSWQLYRKLGSGSYSLLKTISVTTNPSSGTFTDTDLRNGSRSYVLRALNTAGPGPYSTVLSWLLGPQPPRSVTATGLTRRVVVSWAPPVSSWTPQPLSGYAISRISSTGALVRVGTRKATDPPFFPVTGLTPGQKAGVRVQALYGSLTGPASASATAAATSSNLLYVRNHDTGVPQSSRGLMGRGISGGRAVDVDQPQTFTTKMGVFHSSPPALTPSRQHMVVNVDNGLAGWPVRLVVRRTDGAGSPRFLTPDTYSAWSPAVSRDGKWVAFTKILASDGRPHLYKIPFSGGTATLIPNSKDLDEPSWSADGKSLYATRVSSTLGIVKLTLSGTRRTIGTGRNESPVVSPDGKTVAFFTRSTSNVSSLKVLTVSTGGIRTLVSNTGGWATRASWTPGSGTLYFAVFSNSSNATYLRRISRGGSGYTTLPSLGTGAHYVVYEQW